MDSSNQIIDDGYSFKSDFAAKSGQEVVHHGDRTATHTVRNTQTIQIDSDQPVGKVVYSFSFDPNLDATAMQLAQAYEMFEIPELVLTAAATSPQGVSSGSLQGCQMRDPDNDGWEDTDNDSQQNRFRAVRQQDSLHIKPRETNQQVFKFNGKKFTTVSGSKRWSSFGNYYFVVRQTPDAGDVVSFAITIEATIRFHRLSVIQKSNFFATKSSVAECYINDASELIIRLVDDSIVVDKINVKFPIELMAYFDDGKMINKYPITQLEMFSRIINGKPCYFKDLNTFGGLVSDQKRKFTLPYSNLGSKPIAIEV